MSIGGEVYLPVAGWPRAFLVLGTVFLVTSSFTLAKVIRDAQDSGSVVSRLDQARLERLLAEFDPYKIPELPRPAGPSNVSPPPMPPVEFGPTRAPGSSTSRTRKPYDPIHPPPRPATAGRGGRHVRTHSSARPRRYAPPAS